MPVNRKLVVRIVSIFVFVAAFFMNAAYALETPEVAESVAAEKEQNEVVIETSKGNIVLVLFPEKAPITVKNFKAYVKSGFYEDIIFHRVLSAYIIQAGAFMEDLTYKNAHIKIQNESNNGLANRLGTLAMARSGDPHSASTQFFINLKNNKNLDYKKGTENGWGFTVFGKVVSGLDVAMKISFVKTRTQGPMRNVPVIPVKINKMYLR